MWLAAPPVCLSVCLTRPLCARALQAKRAGVNDRKRPENNGAYRMHTAPASMAGIPASINWVEQGAVTEVKDQGICGSCWSFGTAEELEGIHFRKTGELLTLSQQELMDCSWEYGNYGACSLKH